MGIIIERAAAEEVRLLLRRRGLASGRLDHIAREASSLTEEEWETLLALLDPLLREATRRWLVPVVYHAVRMELEQWHQTAKSPPPLLDVVGVARRLNVSERSVERIVAEGLLVPLWVGGSRRFTPESVEGFLKRYTVRGRKGIAKGAKRSG